MAIVRRDTYKIYVYYRNEEWYSCDWCRAVHRLRDNGSMGHDFTSFNTKSDCRCSSHFSWIADTNSYRKPVNITKLDTEMARILYGEGQIDYE